MPMFLLPVTRLPLTSVDPAERRMPAPLSSTLILACEISSLHFQYAADLEQLTANLLFSDGAAAVLLGDQELAPRELAASQLEWPVVPVVVATGRSDVGILVPTLEEIDVVETHRPQRDHDRNRSRRQPMRIDVPPSTGRTTPVTNRASSDARKRAALAASHAVPIPPRRGTCRLRSSRTCSTGTPRAAAIPPTVRCAWWS